MRHGRHQRFHQQPGLRVGFRDHRQRLQHRKIGQRRVGRDAFGEFHCLGQRTAGFGEVLRETIGRALGRRIDPARQHHVGHPRHPDQPRQPHRAAAADEDAALALRQREIGRWLGDADMRRAGQFQPAADHRALQRGDDRHAAILNAVEHPVPHLGMQEAAGRVVIGQFGEVEAGGEMIADAVDDNRADVVGQIRKAVADRQDDAVIERVAFCGAIEADGQHPAGRLDRQQFGLSRGRGGFGVSHVFLCPLQNSYVL